MTQIRLKEKLNYDRDSGMFIWKVRSGSAVAGKVAGSINHGYVEIRLDGKKYMAHRLAWLYEYGSFPEKHIDHINRKKDDNRIENLRDISMAENNRNVDIRKDNTSGHNGVILDRNRWRAYINFNKKRISLGSFANKSDAIEARRKAELKYEFNISTKQDTRSIEC